MPLRMALIACLNAYLNACWNGMLQWYAGMVCWNGMECILECMLEWMLECRPSIGWIPTLLHSPNGGLHSSHSTYYHLLYSSHWDCYWLAFKPNCCINAANFSLVRAFVSPSAVISRVSIHSNWTVPVSTWSRTKCHWISICLIRVWKRGFLMSAITPWLSALISTDFIGNPNPISNSLNKRVNYITSLKA